MDGIKWGIMGVAVANTCRPLITTNVGVSMMPAHGLRSVDACSRCFPKVSDNS